MHRIISGLKWATPLEAKPACIPNGRARGKKAYGVRYERALARAIPEAEHGRWFEFEDRAGRGFCQTDLLLQRKAFCVVLEAKYSWVAEGHSQIEHLYRPVVERAIGKPVLGVVVCRSIVGAPKSVAIASELESAIELALRGGWVVLHWLGGTVLQPSAAHCGQGARVPLSVIDGRT